MPTYTVTLHHDRLMPMKLGYLLLLLGIVLGINITTASDRGYSTVISKIDHDTAELKSSFPQLREFSVAKNVHVDKLKIVYEYKTHDAKHRGGWSAGVPNPDRDGVWFYIDIHEATSERQIHTQPDTIPICLEQKRVSFLVKEGDQTKPVREAIWNILKSHSVERCIL